jgi:transcriptional regulator with XRE-family HTH domain
MGRSPDDRQAPAGDTNWGVAMDQRPQAFGVLVRAYRVRVGLSQLELARQAGLSVRGLREIERDRVRQPRARAVSGLVGALGLPEAERHGLLAGYASAYSDP